MHTPAHTQKCTHTHYNLQTLVRNVNSLVRNVLVIGVYKMQGQMHPNYCRVTDLLVDHPLSPSGYLMITRAHSVADKLPVKALVAWRLRTHAHSYSHLRCTHTHRHFNLQHSRAPMRNVLVYTCAYSHSCEQSCWPLCFIRECG